MAALGKIICMGYFKQDGSQYICPIDMGYSDKSGGKTTHSICPSCMAEMLKSQ